MRICWNRVLSAFGPAMRFHWPYILPSSSAFSQHFIRVSSTNVKWKTSHGNRFLPYILIYWNCSKNIIQVNKRFVVRYFKFAISYLSLDPSLRRLQSSTRMRQTSRIQKKSTVESGLKRCRFGEQIHWFRVDRRPIWQKFRRFKKDPDSCGRGFNKHF